MIKELAKHKDKITVHLGTATDEIVGEAGKVVKVVGTADGKKVEGLTTRDAALAFGINTREDLAQAEGIIRKRILKKFMARAGKTVIQPEAISGKRSAGSTARQPDGQKRFSTLGSVVS